MADTFTNNFNVTEKNLDVFTLEKLRVGCGMTRSIGRFRAALKGHERRIWPK
jgi:hypothetical protein